MDLPEVTPPVNLYLIGFMGTGKSVVGRAVARALAFRFLDSDHEIERRTGKRIKEIFAEEGEAAFRAHERAFIESGHPAEECVVACGGGLVCAPGMREVLLARGVVICLFAREETIIDRITRNDERPLVAVEDPAERVRELLAERLPIYRNTGTGICNDARPTGEVVEHIRRVYNHESARFAKGPLRAG